MIELTSLEFFIIVLVMYHITTLADSIYLHRHWAHHYIKLHKSIVWFFEFWLWFISGAQDQEIGRVHRYHHQTVDTDKDPHSPWVLGKKFILWEMPLTHTFKSLIKCFVYPFLKSEKDSTNNEYPQAFEQGWQYPNLGMFIFFILSIFLFGFTTGLYFFVLNIFLVWFHQEGFGFGLNHLIGYRNYDSNDKSKNVLPWGIIFGGEDLHNNHHAYPGKVNFAHKWFEFDIGYMYIRILTTLNLCEIKTTEK